MPGGQSADQGVPTGKPPVEPDGSRDRSRASRASSVRSGPSPRRPADYEDSSALRWCRDLRLCLSVLPSLWSVVSLVSLACHWLAHWHRVLSHAA